MTQTKFVKIVCATVVLAVQLLWNLVKLVLLAAATILRGINRIRSCSSRTACTLDRVQRRLVQY